MKDYTVIFKEKVGLLLEKLLENGGLKQFEGFSEICGRYAAFISVSDTQEQAYVFRASGDSPKTAWENAAACAEQFISEEKFRPVWVKADLTVKGEKIAFSKAAAAISKARDQSFRRGIAFDENLDTALIEAEINANSLISYKKKSVDLIAVNKYLADCDVKTVSQFPDEVILFDCKSCFCDEKNEIYELYSEGDNCGRRKIARFDKETARRVISTGSEYLSMQVGLDGKFDYGFYPCIPKAIPGYGIVRHAFTIWNMLCDYRVNHDKFILEQAEGAIGFMINNTSYKYPNKEGKENTAYLIDKEKNEVKIGANAGAIMALTEYMSVVGTNKYEKLAKEYGNGILELFDERYGSFFQVLKYPTLAPRDRFRTVFFDGESVFALCRLYGLTGEDRFLEPAKAAVDRFIRKDYVKYADHWVSYAVNELTKYVPEEKYFEFGLKNVAVNLEKIHSRRTAFHTNLELLCAAFDMLSRIKEKNLKCKYLSEFDEKAFVNTIFHRAEYMLNGYCYPEYVMYFPHPISSLGAFFVRQDKFRIRIDDVQHFCGAYYMMYKNFDKLEKLFDNE